MVARLVLAVAEDNVRGLIARPAIEDRLAEVPPRLAAQMDLMGEVLVERAAIAAQQEAAHRQVHDEVDAVHPPHQSGGASGTRGEPQPALLPSRPNRPMSEASSTPPFHPLADITGSTLNITTSSTTTSRLNVHQADVQETPRGFRAFVVNDEGHLVGSDEYEVDEEEVEIQDELIVDRLAGRVEAPRAPQARPAPPSSPSAPASSASPSLQHFPHFSQVSHTSLSIGVFLTLVFTG